MHGAPHTPYVVIASSIQHWIQGDTNGADTFRRRKGPCLQEPARCGQRKTSASYLWWAIHDGQQFATALDYGILPPDAVKAAEAQVLKLQCGSSACLTNQ
jgi:hypothetical protein